MGYHSLTRLGALAVLRVALLGALGPGLVVAEAAVLLGQPRLGVDALDLAPLDAPAAGSRALREQGSPVSPGKWGGPMGGTHPYALQSRRPNAALCRQHQTPGGFYCRGPQFGFEGWVPPPPFLAFCAKALYEGSSALPPVPAHLSPGTHHPGGAGVDVAGTGGIGL